MKAGVIADPALLDLCEARAADLVARALDPVEEAVTRAVRVKAAVVAADPREAGPRRALNLGHTLGHAIEAAAEGALLHGEAVAIGMVAAARLAESTGAADAGLADRLARVLAALGLPVAPPAGLDPAAVAALALRDKKRAGGAVRVVLPVRPGRVVERVLDAAEIRRWAEAALA